jgi:hypothetical protein
MPFSVRLRIFFISIIFIIIFTACGAEKESASVQVEPEIIKPATPTSIIPTNTPIPQTFSEPAVYGPNIENFPANFNPLTAQEVKNPSELQVPALLVSISHFPPAARPQYGLSFAPWVFEFYITEGATRFLSVFYGTFPEAEALVTGGCEIRTEVFEQTKNIIGNYVWLDENKNGIQENYEKGIPGVCVSLYDSSDQMLEQTTTDSNGYYGFNVDAGKYFIRFDLAPWFELTQSNIGYEDKDSDLNQDSGQMEAKVKSDSLLDLDVGLILSEVIPPPHSDPPIPQVGPIRSGRLLYKYLHAFFGSSCLIYAFADPDVLEQIPQCVFVPHDEASGGAMMSFERMQKISKDNQHFTSSDFNYSGNVFTEEEPNTGLPADQINIRVALLNQSGWMYDPLSETYLRSVDDAKVDTVGQLHPAIDSLTNRQLQFENVIVIFVEHETVEPTMIDMPITLGNGGLAYLFRDGRKYDIFWSTRAREYEKKSGQARPIYFVDVNGNQVPLKPGRSWIFIATPYSIVSELEDGVWQVKYVPPIGSK